jgi:hypothetical protein
VVFVDARYRPKISINLTSNKEEFAFLIHATNKNTYIPHVFGEIYECRYLAKNKGKSTLLTPDFVSKSNII